MKNAYENEKKTRNVTNITLSFVLRIFKTNSSTVGGRREYKHLNWLTLNIPNFDQPTFVYFLAYEQVLNAKIIKYVEKEDAVRFYCCNLVVSTQ